MSYREKRLLIIFSLAGFFILNLLGYKFYASSLQTAQGANVAARNLMQKAEVTSRSRDQKAAAMEWLATTTLSRPADYQTVQSALQKLAETEANNAGLTIRNQKLLDTKDTSQPNSISSGGGLAAPPPNQLERVKVQLALTGTEQALYRWINTLTAPDKVRAVTRLLLSPNKEDDSKIDCTADVEQWFTPAAPEA